MLTDVQIAQNAQMEPIKDIAKKVGLEEDDLELYGKYKAKISLETIERLKDADIILSSPYTRALQTAAILSKELNIDIIVETDLHEWLANKNFIYEDDDTAENAYIEYESNHGEYPSSEEKIWENAACIKNRVIKVLKKYSHYKKVIVACHGMMIQATTKGKLPENGEIVKYDLMDE